MWVRLPEGDFVKLAESESLCYSCYKFWTHQGLDPKRMVHVFQDDGRVMVTEVKKIPIIVCPWCDGDVILKLSKDANVT